MDTKYIQQQHNGKFAVVFPESIKTPRRHGSYDTLQDAVTARDEYLAGRELGDNAEPEQDDTHNEYPIVKAAGKRGVGLYDLHCPYQDDKAVATARRIIEAVKPEFILFGGDGVDFYKLSTFLQDESRAKTVQDELDTWYATAKTLIEGTGAAVYYIVGNHDLRLYRYLCANPELASLDALKLESLLRLDDLHATICRGVSLLDNRLVFIHGRYLSKNAGAGVKRELEERAYQQSIVQGHGHRMGRYDKAGPLFDIVGVEVGCLCQDAWYDTDRFWQRGLVVYTEDGGKFELENVKIDDGAVFRGSIYRV